MVERIENRPPQIHALALDAEHLPHIEAAESIGFRRRFGLKLEIDGAAGSGYVIEELGMADELIGEVLAVFEHVDGTTSQTRIRIEPCQPFGVEDHLFQKVLEAVARAP